MTKIKAAVVRKPQRHHGRARRPRRTLLYKLRRLALARELGATHTINAKEQNPVEAILALTGDGVQYSLECAGLPAVVRQATDSLRLTGVCGVIGVAPLGTEVALDMNGILFGRTVRGIIEGDSVPQNFIPRLVELYADGRFPFDRLIKTYPLERIEDTVRASERGDVLKAALLPRRQAA